MKFPESPWASTHTQPNQPHRNVDRNCTGYQYTSKSSTTLTREFFTVPEEASAHCYSKPHHHCLMYSFTPSSAKPFTTAAQPSPRLAAVAQGVTQQNVIHSCFFSRISSALPKGHLLPKGYQLSVLSVLATYENLFKGNPSGLLRLQIHFSS